MTTTETLDTCIRVACLLVSSFLVPWLVARARRETAERKRHALAFAAAAATAIVGSLESAVRDHKEDPAREWNGNAALVYRHRAMAMLDDVAHRELDLLSRDGMKLAGDLIEAQKEASRRATPSNMIATIRNQPTDERVTTPEPLTCAPV